MIQDTAQCEDCAFKVKDGKKCPNYIETIWQEEGNPQPRIIKDCAPKRTLLMLQELYNRTFALQKQVSQSEGLVHELNGQFKLLMSAIQYIQDDKSNRNVKAIE